jgi:hypothetical protein
MRRVRGPGASLRYESEVTCQYELHEPMMKNGRHQWTTAQCVPGHGCWGVAAIRIRSISRELQRDALQLKKFPRYQAAFRTSRAPRGELDLHSLARGGTVAAPRALNAGANRPASPARWCSFESIHRRAPERQDTCRLAVDQAAISLLLCIIVFEKKWSRS